MSAVIKLVAGLWLFAVCAQSLAHLVLYGLLPGAPAWIGRLDFTPQYTILMGLVIAAALARRYAPTEGAASSS